MRILGISCYYHDSAAALIDDGLLIAAAEEERFTRRKHDHGFPHHAIAFCLAQGGLTGADLDYVVFYEKPLLKFERIIQSSLGSWPRSWGVFRESMVAWFNEKLWIKSQILDSVGITSDKLLFADHHMSHAASAFFCSPYEEAAILTCDGVGEWQTTTIGRGRAEWPGRIVPPGADVRPGVDEPPGADVQLGAGVQPRTAAQHDAGVKPGVQPGAPPPIVAGGNSIELLDEVRFPHSLGLLYSAFTAFLGFRVNSGEYKVMGMAPYGEPRYADRVRRLIDVDDAGGFRLNMDYFTFHRSTSQTYGPRFTELFGPPRKHESEFYTPRTSPGRNGRQAEENQYYADIAASIQLVTEETVLAMARYAHERTGSKRLCMAGGVALNSVANGRIVRETPFEDVFIQPAAGDSGGALGAALWAYHVMLGRPRRFVMEHAFWGAEHSEAEAREVLDGYGIPFEAFDDEDELLDRVVDTLLAGRIVAWHRGRFEWGPRALGNRSILADPRRAEMKEIVNTKIKFREPFRPFAPVVLEERAGEYFDLPGLESLYPARYMLLVAPIPEAKQSEIPAVTHVNGTGRLQTVRRDTNPAYYRVVEKFGEATGVPVLLNTSFNLRGEPIVDTPADALATFAHSDIDALVVGQLLVTKERAGADGTFAAVPPPRTVAD